jgi:hypothetical protein
VFEDEAFADKATMAVEKTIHHGGDDVDENAKVVGIEKETIVSEEIKPKSAV